MNKVYIKKDELVIRVPLKQQRSNPYDDFEFTGENIIGIIEPQAKCNIPEFGLAYRIDMLYKGKADQWTDIFYHWHNELEDF